MPFTILVREGENWRQYLLVDDERVVIVHMTPAMFGWNIGRIDKQGASDWPDMKRDDIVAWKMRNDDGLTLLADDDADFRNSGFRERMIVRASE